MRQSLRPQSWGRLMVITTPGIVVARAIASHAKRMSPQVEIIGRVSALECIPSFNELNVKHLVLTEFEAGLEMTRQALVFLRVPATEIQRRTDALRQEIYAPLFASNSDYKTLNQLRNAERGFDLQWVHIVPSSKLAGRSIGEANIRKTTGASVVGVIRAEKLEPNPGPEFQFEPGDLAAIIGTEGARESFIKFV